MNTIFFPRFKVASKWAAFASGARRSSSLSLFLFLLFFFFPFLYRLNPIFQEKDSQKIRIESGCLGVARGKQRGFIIQNTAVLHEW